VDEALRSPATLSVVASRGEGFQVSQANSKLDVFVRPLHDADAGDVVVLYDRATATEPTIGPVPREAWERFVRWPQNRNGRDFRVADLLDIDRADPEISFQATASTEWSADFGFSGQIRLRAYRIRNRHALLTTWRSTGCEAAPGFAGAGRRPREARRRRGANSFAMPRIGRTPIFGDSNIQHWRVTP
jgi:hypothetical protein